jgi:hypothetical protein
MEKSIKQERIEMIVSLLFVLLFVYLFWKKSVDDKILRADHTVLCATISSANGDGRYSASFYFIFKGMKIETQDRCRESTKDRFDAEYTKMLVVVSNTNPYNCRLLESKKEYEEFNVAPKDTTGVICPPEDWHPGLP